MSFFLFFFSYFLAAEGIFGDIFLLSFGVFRVGICEKSLHSFFQG